VFPIGICGGEPALLLGPNLAADFFFIPGRFRMDGAYAQRLCITGFGYIFGSFNIFGQYVRLAQHASQRHRGLLH
jgi:hypothetical protein